MSKDKYIIGIIGAGMIAEKHVASFQKLSDNEVKWVARQNGARLKEFQEKFNIPKGTTDYNDILADPNVDIVVITTPPANHYQMFIDALKAGKHILLEKPITIDALLLEKMVEERQKHPELKVSCCSCRHSRLIPKFKAAKEIIDSGELGDVYYIHHNSVGRQGRPGIEYHPTAKWFLNKDIAGGGPMLDWGVYDLSFHLGLLSDKPDLETIKSAFTKTGLDSVDPGTEIYNTEEHFAACMEFTGGLNYYWERASHANVDVPNETRIYGTKGGIKLAFCTWESNIIEFFDVENNGKGKARTKKIEIDYTNQDDDLELAKHFMAVVKGKEEPLMPIEREKKHLNIVFKIYELTK